MRRRALPSVCTAMSQIGRLTSRSRASGVSFGQSMTEGLYGLNVSRNIAHAAALWASEPSGSFPAGPYQWRAAWSAAATIAGATEPGGTATGDAALPSVMFSFMACRVCLCFHSECRDQAERAGLHDPVRGSTQVECVGQVAHRSLVVGRKRLVAQRDARQGRQPVFVDNEAQN